MLEKRIQDTLEQCKVKGEYNKKMLLVNRNILYSYLHELSSKIDLTTMNFQDISLLYKDKNNHIWSMEGTVVEFIDILVKTQIISINYNKTLFKILFHTLHHILKHCHNLIDAIGEDKFKEISLLSETDLEKYLNSNQHIKNAFEFDKQNWLEGYENG